MILLIEKWKIRRVWLEDIHDKTVSDCIERLLSGTGEILVRPQPKRIGMSSAGGLSRQNADHKGLGLLLLLKIYCHELY